MAQALPKLPADIESVVLTAADMISDAFSAAGLAMRTAEGPPSPFLYSVLSLLKLRCQAGPDGAGWQRRDYLIPLAEIATLLETIGQVMVSEKIEGMAGYDADFFKGCATVVTQAERDLERQMAAINKLLLKGLGESGSNMAEPLD
jgi:hypothetical protein